MTQDQYARKLDELETLLNDPDVPMDPARVWALLADLSGRDAGMATGRRAGVGADLAALAGAGD
jgi:ribosomal protein L12E/L44/L45/RPP1/RPP2